RAAPARLRAVPRVSRHLPKDPRADRSGRPRADAGRDEAAAPPLPARSVAAPGVTRAEVAEWSGLAAPAPSMRCAHPAPKMVKSTGGRRGSSVAEQLIRNQ